MYASTEAEKVCAAQVEGNPEARQVVDDINFMQSELRRLDQSELDTAEDKGVVEFAAVPKKLNGFQKFTGWGATAVEDMAGVASSKNDVAQLLGSMTEKQLDVTVNFENDKKPMVYSKVEQEDGAVFFQRGADAVSMDKHGNLVMTQLPEGSY
jgi:hypothetical protein